MKRSLFAESVMMVAAAACMMLSAAVPAVALEPNPCAKDFKEHCADVTPGGGRLVRCYEERKDKMSAECRAWAERVKAHAAVLREACAKEIDLFCGVHKGDPFDMLDCLEGNSINLSSECTAKLGEFKWLHPKPVR